MQEMFSVSSLNEYLQHLMEGDSVLSDITVRGEISNFKNHSSGHCYFSLKDETGAVRAVMFRSNAARLRFVPENGMKVIVHGRVSVFVRSGDYQIYVDGMQPDGIGALALAFEQLRRRLSAEGLFDESLKRPLPQYPSRIGVVTSPTGAAVRDILQIFARRYPAAEVILYPAIVQGPTAPASLVAGLSCFAERVPVDVIIIGRGGGSMEDLWCFNYENVVRAVAASPVPVISAVGHETDFTLCDFAADLRAPTPSAAAELAVPDVRELAERLGSLAGYMEMRMSERLRAWRTKLQTFAASSALRSPMHTVEEKRMLLDFALRRLNTAADGQLAPAKAAFSELCAKMQVLNPAGVLARGYAIVFDENGRTVSSADTLSAGQTLCIRMRDGDVTAVTCAREGDKNG